MEAFLEDHPNYPSKKDYFMSSKVKTMRSIENFALWGFECDPAIDDAIYLAWLLICWLCCLFLLVLIPISPETFHGRGDEYDQRQKVESGCFLSCPCISNLMGVPGHSSNVKRTYGPWSLVIGLLRMHFPRCIGSIPSTWKRYRPYDLDSI